MNKIKFYLLCLLGSFSMMACADDQPQVNDSEFTVKDDAKILIVYFSRTGYNYPNDWLDIGHTARIAGYIEEFTGGDTFEIVPVVPYPDDYEETKTISTNERDNNLRPEFIGEIENIDDYDVVFIGGPVWYGGMPMIMHTFYDKYKDKLNGKTIAPFDTHEGSGIADYVSSAKSYCPDSNVLEGLATQGRNSVNAANSVKDWLIRIGIIKESAGIASIDANNESRVVYYNLAGTPVENPGKGFYVKVLGDKSTKILK